MEGRVVSVTRNIGLADVRPDTTARLDALARVVQDVADADAATADVDMGIWILRRMDLRLARTPRLRADVSARTWCSGVGPRWAERRTQMHVNDAPCVDATAIWVHTDRLTGAPAALPAGFEDLWGVSAHGRKVSARLRHPPPAVDVRRARWPLRATDLDVVGHVNNAAYWAAAEEELARRGWPRVATAEIEFRAGLDLGESVDCLVSDAEDSFGFAMWLCVDGGVRASMLIGCEP